MVFGTCGAVAGSLLVVWVAGESRIHVVQRTRRDGGLRPPRPPAAAAPVPCRAASHFPLFSAQDLLIAGCTHSLAPARRCVHTVAAMSNLDDEFLKFQAELFEAEMAAEKPEEHAPQQQEVQTALC